MGNINKLLGRNLILHNVRIHDKHLVSSNWLFDTCRWVQDGQCLPIDFGNNKTILPFCCEGQWFMSLYNDSITHFKVSSISPAG